MLNTFYTRGFTITLSKSLLVFHQQLAYRIELYPIQRSAPWPRQISQYLHNSLNHLGSLTSLIKPTFNNLSILVMISGRILLLLFSLLIAFIKSYEREFLTCLGHVPDYVCQSEK